MYLQYLSNLYQFFSQDIMVRKVKWLLRQL